MPTSIVGQPAVPAPCRPDGEGPRGDGALPRPGMASAETAMSEDIPPMDETPQRGKERPAKGASPALASACGSETAQEKAKKNSWSTVVRNGRKRSVKTHEGKPRNTRKMPGSTGTAVISNDELSTVGKKMVSVFATKFNVNLEADTLRLFLQEQMNRRG